MKIGRKSEQTHSVADLPLHADCGGDCGVIILLTAVVPKITEQFVHMNSNCR